MIRLISIIQSIIASFVVDANLVRVRSCGFILNHCVITDALHNNAAVAHGY